MNNYYLIINICVFNYSFGIHFIIFDIPEYLCSDFQDNNMVETMR